MTKRRMSIDLAPKVAQVLDNLRLYHAQYYAVQTFGGPSLHFHRRALGLNGTVSSMQQAELVYAVLTSWGMHRMGKGGSKMLPFEAFVKNLNPLSGAIKNAKEIKPRSMAPGDWDLLEEVFRGIRVMATGTSIVGNSKVMAHLIPNAVAPVDREYTLKFLFGNGAITNGLPGEWQLMRKIHEEFFYPIAQDAGFRSQSQKWIGDQTKWPWDTLPLKVVDNLVIGAMK